MNSPVDYENHPEYDKLIIDSVHKGITNKNEIAKLIPNATYKSIEHRIARLKNSGKLSFISSTEKEEKLTEVIKIGRKEIPDFTKELGKVVTNTLNSLNLKFKDIPLQVRYNKEKQEHISILNLSDIHLGEVNKVFDSKLGKEILTYDYKIFLRELSVLKNTVYRLHTIQSHSFNLKVLYVNLLGDILTNDRIFEGQTFHIDMVVGEQLWRAVYNLFDFINDMKVIYDKIIVTGVVGNHGRSTNNSKFDEPTENNYEYHLYKILEFMFKDDSRVVVNVPRTRCHIITIGNWKHMLTHGDIFKGSNESTIEKQIKDLLLNIGEFQAIDFGHFHKINDTKMGDRILIKQNGSWVEKDNYALKNYKLYSIPEQFFYGCSEKRKETWSYKIDLRTNMEDK